MSSPTAAAVWDAGARTTEADQVHTGAMIALVPSPADAARLAVPDGEPVNELHLTLLYLGQAADIDESLRRIIVDTVDDVVDNLAPVHAEAFAVSVFNPSGDEPCIVLGVSGGPGLEALHDAIVDEVADLADLALPEQHSPWIPHITLTYTGDVERVAQLVDRVGPVIFDRVRVVFAGEPVDLPLDAAPEQVAEADAPGNNLKAYWLHGEGLAKWAPSPHPWTSLYHHLRKHMVDELAKRVAAQWFHEHFGFWPGSDLNRVAHGKPPRGDRVGPG